MVVVVCWHRVWTLFFYFLILTGRGWVCLLVVVVGVIVLVVFQSEAVINAIYFAWKTRRRPSSVFERGVSVCFCVYIINIVFYIAWNCVVQGVVEIVQDNR